MRKYVGGESHPYFGRKYRLKISPSDKDKVLLKSGYFCIECTNQNTSHVQTLLESWYRRKALMYISKILDDCWDRFNEGNYPKPKLKIQEMEKRWGSLSGKGQLTLNTSLIQAPKECIEYVITHELCHLVHHNHGSEFYKLLDRMMPDWIKRKHKLEMSLV